MSVIVPSSNGGANSGGALIPFTFFASGSIGVGTNIDVPIAVNTSSGSSVLPWVAPFAGNIRFASYTSRSSSGTVALNVILNGGLDTTLTGTPGNAKGTFSSLNIPVLEGDTIAGSINNSGGTVVDIAFTFYMEKV